MAPSVSQGKRGANRSASLLDSREALGGVDQRRADARLERAVAGVGHDDVARLRPGARQRVGGHRRADDVVAALHDGAGQMADAVEIRPRPALGHEGAVGEVMRLDARQGQREAAMVRFEGRARRRIERRAGRLVAAPGARRRAMAVGIAIGQAAIVVAQADRRARPPADARRSRATPRGRSRACRGGTSRSPCARRGRCRAG